MALHDSAAGHWETEHAWWCGQSDPYTNALRTACIHICIHNWNTIHNVSANASLSVTVNSTKKNTRKTHLNLNIHDAESYIQTLHTDFIFYHSRVRVPQSMPPLPKVQSALWPCCQRSMSYNCQATVRSINYYTTKPTHTLLNFAFWYTHINYYKWTRFEAEQTVAHFLFFSSNSQGINPQAQTWYAPPFPPPQSLLILLCQKSASKLEFAPDATDHHDWPVHLFIRDGDVGTGLHVQELVNGTL